MTFVFYPTLTTSDLFLDVVSAEGNASPLPLEVSSSDAFDPAGGPDQTAAEEAEPLDIWAVIKPGHVQEKIAIFGSGGRRLDGSRVTWVKDGGGAGPVRVRKSKGTWEGKGGAKRQRHSASCDPRTHRRSWSPEWVGEGAEPKVSVGEMVACLETRFSQQQRAPEGLQRDGVPGPDGVRVSAMVARLQPDGLRTQSDCSRLKRMVGRVLLATANVGPSHCQPAVTPAPQEVMPASLATPPAREVTPLQPEEVEPPPGLLFLSPAPAPVCWGPSPTDSGSSPTDYGLAPVCWGPSPTDYGPTPTEPGSPPTDYGPAPVCWGPTPTDSESSPTDYGAAPSGRASEACVFLEARRRLQQLLEPQALLPLLPPHLLVQTFGLLPTRSLAALKSTCRHFRFIVDTYDVRPADSLWVSDPCYRDDPCKQCKKRRGRGDVSPCRWHHKPWCQALPYGPGYWMCCHGVHKDTPGCNVGLHDNRWVPAFHLPVCRRSQQD